MCVAVAKNRAAARTDVGCEKSVWPLHIMSAETDLKTKRFHLQGEPCPMPMKDDNRQIGSKIIL